MPPKGNSSGGGEAACRPKRYSSLRQRPPTEVTISPIDGNYRSQALNILFMHNYERDHVAKD